MELFLIFILGTCLGSFYNVVALRLMDGKEVNHFIFGRSSCPKCEEILAPLELIPLISFLALRGRCRHCRGKISPIYFVGEMITGITFVIIFVSIGASLSLIPHLLLGSLLVISVITDLLKGIVLNKMIFFFGILILLTRIVIIEELFYHLISGLFSFLLLFAVMVLSGHKMGGGDVKLYGIIGLGVGLLDSLASLFFASLIGLAVMLPGLISGRISRKTEIPFVPFIWAGVMVTYMVDVLTIFI
ncbi:prepilin peptidase [Natranaerobius thermophilus]|nr:A24 family peptidase [Natranaerobius thermophilus]